MTADTAPTVPSCFARPLAYAGGLAAVWLVAAAVRPELTYHLAPLLVAGTPPVVMALDRQDPASRRALGWAAFLGFVAAVAMAILLAVAGWLEGPAFEPFANPLVESIIGGAIGATGGLLFFSGEAALTYGKRSPPRIGMARWFSGGASGHDHWGL